MTTQFKPQIKPQITTRLQQLQATLSPTDAILISNPTDVIYFSGFGYLVPGEREAFLVISQKDAVLHHASFSPYELKNKLKVVKNVSLAAVAKTLGDLRVGRVLFDKADLVVQELEFLKKNTELRFRGFKRDKVWQIRMVKDDFEQAQLKAAAKMTSRVMAKIIESLHIGQTEIEIRNKIETELKKAGSGELAFPIIVAFDQHAALPHHQPTQAKLKAETVVLLDFGATINGYRGDMTRTIWFGQKPSRKFQQVETVIQDSYALGLRYLKNEARPSAAQLDQNIRLHIQEAGFGANFIHTSGHGVGLDIHEQPSLHSQNPQLLLPGMVITVEPGIYLENKFGYRHENMVLMTTDGPEELTL